MIIVYGLHHLVSDAKHVFPEGKLGDLPSRRIDRPLQQHVQMLDSGVSGFHGTKHLNVRRLYARKTRKPFSHQSNNEPGGFFLRFGLYKEEIPASVVYDGHFALVDEMRVADDYGIGRLPVNVAEKTDRYNVALYDVGKHVPRPHRRKLILVPDKHNPAAPLHRLQQCVEYENIHHGRLVHYNHVGSQRIVFVSHEKHPVSVGVLQRPMDGLCMSAGGLLDTLGSAPCGTHTLHLAPHRLKYGT